ncbi:MAG TPA: hypothetical protein VM597_33375 [Gemmataceae bacterium]|nr:hypothetical protein [Gemmataceae bacterium]
MRFVRRAFLTAAAGLALVVGAPAQEKIEVNGGFRAFVVVEPRFPESDIRNRTGKMPDLVTEHGLNPVVAVFSRTVPNQADNPLVPVVRVTDALVEKYKARKLGSYLVFLALPDEYRKALKDNTADAKVAEVKQWANGAKPTKTTVALAEATVKNEADTLVPKQVTDLGIENDDDVTILFYHQYRVVKRWKYKAGMAPSDADLKDLQDTVAATLGGKR